MLINKVNLYKSSSLKMAVAFAFVLLCALSIVVYLVLNSYDESLSKSYLMWLSIGMILTVSLLNFFIAIYVVKRINTICQTASDIMKSNQLSSRITMNYEWDDLSKLATILNAMLNEIESLVHNISQVSTNIAHDLRTPLTRLKNKLHQIKDDPLKESLLEETDKLLTMFNGLLRIANIESKKRLEQFESVSLQEIVIDAVDFYEPIADDKNIRIEINMDNQFLVADRDLIFQVISNIMDNAIKFTPNHGNIKINSRHEGGYIVLSISDTGVGIASTEYNQVTQRFYRSDSSRSTKGYGLGLALVKAVMNLHKGTIAFKASQPAGLTVELRFISEHKSINNNKVKS